MAMDELTQKTVVEIEADNRDYLAAVKANERADAAASKKRDQAIAATLKAQGRLTEETFRTAKAVDTVSLSMQKQATQSAKTIDFLAGKLKATGSSIVSGIFGGVVGGVLGGGVSSLVAKLFEPPTPSESIKLARSLESTTGLLADMNKEWADNIRSRVQAEQAQEALNKEMEVMRDLTVDLLGRFSETAAIDAYSMRIRAIGSAFAFGTMNMYDFWRAKTTLDLEEQKRRQDRAAGDRALVAGRLPGRAGGRGASGGRFEIDALELPQFDASYESADSPTRLRREAIERGLRLMEQNRGVFPTGPVSTAGVDAAHARSSLPPHMQAEIEGRYRTSRLESMFGPIEDFNAYTEAFGALESAVSSAMMAWISGQESFGVAFKKGLAAAIAGTSVEMGIQALKHGAFAIGHLAFSDPYGAARHGKAAAAFAAGSIAAAVAAKALGGGASGNYGGGVVGGGGYSSGGRDQRTGGSGGGNGQVINVYVNDPYASDDARTVHRRREREIRKATGGYGAGPG